MSVFSCLPEDTWVCSNALAFAFRDPHPVSPGHTLVVTRRVTPDWFSATPEERAAVLELVEEVKRQLDEELHPDGYNVGFNAGEAAGQTVMHLHVHVIPRFRGDMDDPRGGVRHVIPSKGNYLRNVLRGEKCAPFSKACHDELISGSRGSHEQRSFLSLHVLFTGRLIGVALELEGERCPPGRPR